MKITDEIIKKHEAQITEAEKNGNAVVLNQLLAEDFTGINIFGHQIDKSDFVKHACNSDIEISQLNVVESTVKIVGSVGIVIGKADFNSTFKGNPINGSTRFIDVWELRLSGGVLISSSVTLDGASRS